MNARVLIVDDEPAILDMLGEMFRVEGFIVDTCASARDACSRLQQSSPDLVITDMRMETPSSGYEVLRAIQQLSNPPPVILFTAFPVSPADVRSYGVDTVLMKGVNPSAVVAKARELLQAGQRTTGAASNRADFRK